MKCTGTHIDHCHREPWMRPDIKIHIRNQEVSNRTESQSGKNKKRIYKAGNAGIT